VCKSRRKDCVSLVPCSKQVKLSIEVQCSAVQSESGHHLVMSFSARAIARARARAS
jgi:hypothetical protein